MIDTTHKILITGSTGFIGSNTTEAFKSYGQDIEIFNGDITKEEDWKENLANDQIIYLIAGKRTETTEDFRVNSESILALFKAIRNTKVRPYKIVLASSQAVYIGNSAPFFETDTPQAHTVYAQSKLRGENNLVVLCHEYSIPFIILRYSTVLGRGIRQKSNMSGPLFAWWNASATGEPIKVFQDGEQTRDYIHIEDVVQSNLISVALPEGIYNVGGGNDVKVKDLAKMVKVAMNSKSEIAIDGGDATSSDPKRMFSNIEKLMEFGWSPTKSIESAVYSFVKSQRLEK
jgi:UDP-glucose 4-epimerase